MYKSQLELKWQGCLLAVCMQLTKRIQANFYLHLLTNRAVSDEQQQLEISFKNDVILG